MEEQITLDRWNDRLDPPPVPLPIPERVEGVGTIDRLAQSVIPKLLNKLNDAEWRVRRLEYLVLQLILANDAQAANIREMSKWMTEATAKLNAFTAQPAPSVKKRASRKKAEAVPMSEIADYDPDKDEWKPKMIDGKAITGALIDVVDHMGTSAGTVYSAELLAFIDNLTDKQRAAIAERFPN